MKPLRWADGHPALTTWFTALLVFVCLRAWTWLSDGPVLLGRADPNHRLAIYSQLAASAVAVLGITLTVLAILLALPDRPAINDVRKSDTWPRLRGLLLSVALLALFTMVAAHVGTGIDTGSRGREWLEQSMLACAATTVLALLVAGLTFWLILIRADEPDDPSRGRASTPSGSGPGSSQTN